MESANSLNSCRIYHFTVAGWNKDYKAGPFPKTEKEQLAAAKKYYLLPEEYKPYADDGLGYGDYPKVGYGLGVEAKDVYYPWDYPEHKRNLHEPVSKIKSIQYTLLMHIQTHFLTDFGGPRSVQ